MTNTLKLVDTLCANKDMGSLLTVCKHKSLHYFGMFISTCLMRRRIGETHEDDLQAYFNHFRNKISERKELKQALIGNTPIRIQILCNWETSERIAQLWNKMSQGDYRWNRLQLVWENDEEVDFWVIINRPIPGSKFVPAKSIVFQMEPNMTPDLWGEWSHPDTSVFLHVFTHANAYNNIEWHLKSTWSELTSEEPVKTKLFSTVLSGKYYDEGHVKRVNFVKFLEQRIRIDVYGDNKFGYKNYIGPLPYHEKDDALMPYKYTFNAENNSVDNYFTEKIVDAILSECVCFYWGCPNLETHIHPACFIRLSLIDFEADLKLVVDALQNDEWSKRIDVIRQEKKRILNELQFFPRLEKLLGLKKE